MNGLANCGLSHGSDEYRKYDRGMRDGKGRKTMKLAHFACAFGRHSVDQSAIRRVHGGIVSRCRHCATPLEESTPHHWTVQPVRDAGLGERLIR